ncbi:MAG: hypothetical protein WBA57_08760 [Elainellaceae cyanobacterium]
MARRDARDLVHVPVFANNNGNNVATGALYGFMTNIDAADRATLGQTAVDGAYPAGLIIGANAPKPPRASRIRATGTTSSYYDLANEAAIRTAGWRTGSRGRIRTRNVTARSRTVFVTVGLIKYAWQIPNDTFTQLGGDAAALGVEEPDAGDNDLVFGASYPKPPRAAQTIFGDDGTDTYSTFIDPAAVDNLPAGWRKVSEGT